MRFLVDNTEYPYYGKLTLPFEVGTHRQQGTQKARLFQGMAVQGSGMTLFTEFRLLRYKQYRSKHFGVAAKWLKFQGFKLSYVLMDREFYRASLVKELKTQHLPIIIPAKKYTRVKKRFREFLLKQRGICDKMYFTQSPKTKPWPSFVFVNLVLIAHKEQSPFEIGRKFWRQKLTFDEAMHEMAGFYTTLKSRKI